jgi:hypothetical protein
VVVTEAPVLPPGWTSADIGAPSVAGSSTESNGRYTLSSAGEVGGTADQFHFVYRQVTGDVEIRGRVASIQDIQPWSKAGVMVRESLDANSVMGMMFISSVSGSAFHQRVTTGAGRTSASGTAVAAPYWVRLERRGSVLTASQSADGTTWSTIGTMSVGAPTIHVGLAVASGDPSQAATGMLDNVVVNALASNQPPAVSLTGPANGATFTAPATIGLTATASDSDGTVTSVEFYSAGTTLLGTDTTAPYSFTWNNVPAGTYQLTAVARDNASGMTVSSTSTITVTTSTMPTRALFTASANHDTAVDSYLLEIFPEGADPDAANPVAAQNIGKPPVVAGECDVDIETLIQGLAPGNYIATLTAIGSAGTARSAPSPAFTR